MKPPQEFKVVSLRECPTPESLLICETPEQVADYWRLNFATNPYFDPECECLAVLLLNTRRRVKGHQLVSMGTIDTLLVDPRTVFRTAVIASAAAIVLAHSHPSGEGNWTEPFLFRAPLAKLPAGLSEVEIQSSQSPLLSLPTKFDDAFAKWQPHQVVEVADPTETAPQALSEDKLRLLRKVVGNPGKSVSYYCRATRLNGKRLAEIREQLVAQGYIREYSVASKPRGRTSIVIEPLAPATEAVRANPECKP